MRHRISPRWILVFHVAWPAVMCMTGCAEQSKPAAKPKRIQQTSKTAIVEQMEREPVRFLEELSRRTESLDQYELTFYRQERSGVLRPKLGSLEEIHAKFRKEPFSVTFEWLSPDADYYDSVYIEGQNNNKQVVRERHGMLGLPPQTRVVNVMDPVTFGKSKGPITEFGLAQAMRKTLASFRDPELRDVVTIHYEGLVDLDPMGRPAYTCESRDPMFRRSATPCRIFTSTPRRFCPQGRISIFRAASSMRSIATKT
jgi:hypothetical protein